MHLFFDTETTGIPKDYKAPSSDTDNWPRLVQIAWVVTDDNASEEVAKEYIIKPVGFDIPEEAAQIHGITTIMAQERGADLGSVLDAIGSDIDSASVLIAHNIQFDEKILGAEFVRSGHVDVVASKNRKCTMRESTSYCDLPGYYGNKWPKLEELHVKLFGETFDGAHNALVDVRACMKFYFELKRLGIMT